MSDSIKALCVRMATGEPMDGDLSWCKRRLEVLDDWPDALNREQLAEKARLLEWLREYAG